MSRLTHTDAGFLRSLHISRSSLFIFTEGGLDRPYAERLVAGSFPNKSWGHRIIAIKEFPSATGGKPALLSLFKFLRSKRQLSFSAFGKPTVCIILADKDIDDVTRKKLRSPHLFYTPTYDVEGLLFQCSDLIQAVSDACLVTRAQASQLIGNPQSWVSSHVAKWKEWTCLAMLSHTKSVNVGCGYSLPSTINPNYTQVTDLAKFAILKSKVELELGLSPSFFASAFSRIEAKFNSSFSDAPLKFFKGKWLQIILQKHIENQPRIADAHISQVGDRIVAALVAQVGVNTACMCCAPFQSDLRSLCAHL